MNKKNYRADIDGLRAIAIVLVICFHFFPNVIAGGFIGVDVFFVISGYLITGIILSEMKEKNFSLGGFYYRRIRRLFPSLLTVLLFCFIAGQFLLVPAENYQLNKNLLGGLLFVANFTLWTDAGYFNIYSEQNPLLHLWSLGVEEQFYLFWPAFLMVLARYAKAFILPAVILLLIFSFSLNIIFVETRPDLTFYFPFTRFWEIFFGVFLAVLHSGKHKINPGNMTSNIASLAGFFCILSGAFLIDGNTWFPGWWGLYPAIGATLVIYAGPESLLNKYILSHKWPVWVGLISYPLYLWHWPLYAFSSNVLQHWPFYLDKYFLIALSFLLAALSYQYLELPAKKMGIERVIKLSLSTATGLAVLSLVIFSTGGWTISHSTNRGLPEELQALNASDFSDDLDVGWRTGECFLERGQGPERFSNACLKQAIEETVIIWGDSHAAALFPGLQELAEIEGFNLGQFTASACPPILDWNGAINRNCKDINYHVLNLIKESEPGTVILHAAWYWNEYEWQQVESTIRSLKESGVQRIILLGAAPSWQNTVPRVINQYFSNYNEIPPRYTSFQLDTKSISNLDYRLNTLADKNEIHFASLKNIFCNDEGCMLYLDSPLDVTSLDSGHLSKKAAIFAADHLAVLLLDQ